MTTSAPRGVLRGSRNIDHVQIHAGTGALLIVAFCIGVAAAPGDQTTAPVLKGSAAFGGFDQDRPGLRRLIQPQDLPPVTRSTTASAQGATRPEGAVPKVPEGFSVALVASGLTGPRAINIAPNGDVFIAESRANRVRVLRLSADDSKPAVNQIFAGGLHQPFGIAFYPLGPNPEWIYVANSNSVVRFPYKSGDVIGGRLPRADHQRHPLDVSLHARHPLHSGRQPLAADSRLGLK